MRLTLSILLLIITCAVNAQHDQFQREKIQRDKERIKASNIRFMKHNDMNMGRTHVYYNRDGNATAYIYLTMQGDTNYSSYYTYDNKGNPATFKTFGGKPKRLGSFVSYVYDDRNMLFQQVWHHVENPDIKDTINFIYDTYGNPISDHKGFVYDYTYSDDSLLLVSKQYMSNDTSTIQTYSYNHYRQLVKSHWKFRDRTEETEEYFIDDKGNLIQQFSRSLTDGWCMNYNLQYDDMGNLLRMILYNEREQPIYDLQYEYAYFD